MRFSVVAAAAAALPALVSAADILVQVGAGGQLAFSPPNVTAAVGDTISFQFQGKNHSVTQSTFANPCAIQTAPAQGIDSGFQFVPANATELPQWSFTVNNASSPLWFFCAQTIPANHCQKGMVFSVNAPLEGAKTFAAYQAAAMGQNAAAAGASSIAGDVASAVASGAAAATAAAGSVVGQATAAAGSIAGQATAAVGSAAGAAATDAASLLTKAAGAITGANPAASGAANLTGAGFQLSASPVHFLAAFGLAAGLLV